MIFVFGNGLTTAAIAERVVAVVRRHPMPACCGIWPS